MGMEMIKIIKNSDHNHHNHHHQIHADAIGGGDALCQHVKRGDHEAVIRRIKQAQGGDQPGSIVNQRHAYGWGAIHVAAIQGDHRMVRLLLANGAEVDMGDQYTPLGSHVATPSAPMKEDTHHIMRARIAQFSSILR